MQQRAGLARALVMEPKLLLMDEPFSAIDAQTREQLQFEMLRIWDKRPTAMMFVTHAIDEAVLMGDRVVVLAGRPAHVRAVREVNLPRPRDRSVVSSPAFIESARAGLARSVRPAGRQWRARMNFDKSFNKSVDQDASVQQNRED